MVYFDLREGICSLVPGAEYRGTFVEHDEAEYNALQWLDPREKPAYVDVEAAALSMMRTHWRDEINTKTDIMITSSMYFNDGVNTVNVSMKVEEQINIMGMTLIKMLGNMTGTDYLAAADIIFPYNLKVSDNADGEGNYITLQSSDHLLQFFLEGLAHKNYCIMSGRALKDTLGTMNRTALEEFRDER